MKYLNKILVVLIVLSFAGCIGNDKPNDDVDGYDVEIDELRISFQIEFSEPFERTFILIPIIISEENELVDIDKIEEGDGIIESHTELTEFGWCLNITISTYTINNQTYDDYLSDSILFEYKSNGIVFNTSKNHIINDRFFQQIPGVSVWEENDNKINTWIYCNNTTSFIRFKYKRGSGSSNLVDWNTDPELERPPGWHKLELTRKVMFSPLETD